jgi:phage tail sheath protein FI
VLRTGVPAFLGRLAGGPLVATSLTRSSQFLEIYSPAPGSHLAAVVRGFFENGGEMCYVVGLDGSLPAREAVQRALLALDEVADVDLICAPDLFTLRDPLGSDGPTESQVAVWQRMILELCADRGDRFAILDAVPATDLGPVLSQRAELSGPAAGFGALYHPWLLVPAVDRVLAPVRVPPCGHLAGIYARSDLQDGTHKAPANEVAEEVLDVVADLDAAGLALLANAGVNSIRALPGRGIRAWGTRTLSDEADWQDITTRRTIIEISRWVEQFMLTTVHEPNDVRLWVRIMRELTGYLESIFQRGALTGNSAEEAFYVKCDGETNSPDSRDAGLVVTQIGVALTRPAEFIVVRVIQSANGVNVDAT